jgi:hypothetical protein
MFPMASFMSDAMGQNTYEAALFESLKLNTCIITNSQ